MLLRRHPRRFLVALGALLAVGIALRLARPPVDRALTVVVRRGDLVAQVSAAGTLRPASSITYRSPLAGREAEITQLAPEGVLVNEGDLVARLDTTELEADLLRAVQDARQAEVELRVVEVERQDVLGQIDSLKEGEGALGIAETQAALKRSERNVERLRQEYEGLKPLLDKGFVTRDEFQRSAAELEQAEAELALARRKAECRSRARGPARSSARGCSSRRRKPRSRTRVPACARRRAASRMLRQELEGCSMYARAGGLVVYEDFLGASPRRKVRVGDRVTASQGLVTIPEVQRMVVEASVPEGEVHRVAAGQPATVRLDAFPGLVLTGRVSRVGTLARSSVERPWEAKRFDLIVDLDATTAALRPEMTARADVRVGELKDVLLLPINAVFEQQGSFVCHVVRLLGVETRLVSLGESNDDAGGRARGAARGRPRRAHRSLGQRAGPGRRPPASPCSCRSAAAPAGRSSRRAERRCRAPSRDLLLWARRHGRDPGSFVAISAEALGRYKLRTTLSVLGVVLGVAAVIAMMSVSEGARHDTLEQVQLHGPRQHRAARPRPQPGQGGGLTTGDAARLKALVPLTLHASPLVERFGEVYGNGRTQMALVIGVGDEYQAVLRLALAQGRFFGPLDVHAAGRRLRAGRRRSRGSSSATRRPWARASATRATGTRSWGCSATAPRTPAASDRSRAATSTDPDRSDLDAPARAALGGGGEAGRRDLAPPGGRAEGRGDRPHREPHARPSRPRRRARSRW